MSEFDAKVRPAIAKKYDAMVARRRDLHEHPELAFEEERTSGIVVDRLKELGYSVSRAAKTGVVGVLDGGDGPTIAYRADMDALPLQEEGDVPYRSQTPGKMHACGHDGHTTILLTWAEYLAEHRDRLKGRVKLLFQPAEEGPGGAKPMVADGVLKNPDVDHVVGLHLWNPMPAGFVGVRGGAIMASADEFIFTVVGRGGHGAIPQQTIDAIPIAAQVISALQTIVSRNVDPNDPAVLSIGQVNGGSNFNIIAQEVRLRGTVRTLSLQTRAMIKARIEQVAGGICRAMGADYRYEWIDHYPVTINDDAVADVVAECARDVVGTTHVVEPDLTLGAEDVSYFLREVPGCYFFLGSADEAAGKNKPHHHPEFDFDERVMPVGVEIFARVAEHYTGQRLE